MGHSGDRRSSGETFLHLKWGLWWGRQGQVCPWPAYGLPGGALGVGR